MSKKMYVQKMMDATTKATEVQIDIATKVGKKKIELTKNAYDDASVLRRRFLNIGNDEGSVENLDDILGCWYYEALEIPGIGVRKNHIADDYYFEMKEKGEAIVCVNGIKYHTTYHMEDGCISFAHAELAAMKLTMKEDKLCLNGYLGTNVLFTKNVVE